MADPAYPVFPICAFLGFLFSLIPLPWHLRAWNSGTCFFMMWSSLACLNQLVNSITWHNNWANHAPIWCKFSIRIIMGCAVGLPAASLCINRRLYHIITAKTTAITKRDKRHALVIDTIICLLFPVVYISLQYVVQGRRFDIYEDIGCFPALYNTPLMYFISNIWPLIIGAVSAFYCDNSLSSPLSRFNQEF
ncbi:Pheromone B alpha 3 receptor [Leucoagaricus sp. SymC.cos]|nr:Pheromone B alpha 3 receptor [Leucoagaricus sp. SymC.cos]